MLTEGRTLARAGVDALALKPAEVDLDRAVNLDHDVVIDYEGREHLPSPATLARLAADRSVRVTAPVRADGFDPLGDDSLYARLPDEASLALVAGNGAYLTAEERSRAVAPRLRAATERFPEAWVGTEGVERLALVAGSTQFDLLAPGTERELRALRAAGYDGGLAVYAPTAVTDDEDALLDALGDYVARRGPVAEALPAGAPTDGTATGRTRVVLSEAVREYALVGAPETIAARVAALEDAGADAVVCYPARGLAALE